LHLADTVRAGGTAAGADYGAVGRSRAYVRNRFTGWLAPDLALSVALVTVLYLMVLPGGATALFRDSDAGWHIRAGERMLATGRLPQGDPFSFSKAGEAWVAWEWLADAMVGGIHLSAGLGGVAFLYALAIGVSVWMWFRLNWAAGGNFLLACLFASPLLSTTSLHWLARPHVFSWLFLLGSVWFCERLPGRVAGKHLAAIGLASALWANLHGSFFLGAAIAMVYGCGAWLGRLLWDRQGRSVRAYFLVAGAAAAGSLLNPNGWQLHRHVLAYLSDAALLDRIGEFQSFNFHVAGSAQILLALLLGAAGGFAALYARRPERFLLALLLTAGALRSARLLPVAALLLLPLANGSLTAALSSAALAGEARRRLDAVLDYGLGLRALDRSLHGLALAPLFAVVLFGAMQVSHAGFPADQFPVGAAGSVASLPADARLFAPDKFGGYLIYRFNGTRKVFFDGRSDFYGADFLKRYSRMVQVRPGWSREFSKWQFTHALLPVDYSLIPALEVQGWTEIYRDGTSVLLASPGGGEPKA
jgi:hypothetical protein